MIEQNDLSDFDDNFKKINKWESFKSFLKVCWTIRKRDSSFFFVWGISLLVGLINLNIDYGSISVINENKYPEPSPMLSGFQQINQSINFIPNFNLKLSPKNNITNNINNNNPFKIKNFTLYDNIETLATNLDSLTNPGVGFHIDTFNITDKTQIRTVSNLFDTSIAINAASELLISETNCNFTDFNFSLVGFPHPPLDRKSVV